MSRMEVTGTAAPRRLSPQDAGPAVAAGALRPASPEEQAMAKALIWAVVIIFLIGLAVVIGVFDFIF
jgi:hypothetical protein